MCLCVCVYVYVCEILLNTEYIAGFLLPHNWLPADEAGDNHMRLNEPKTLLLCSHACINIAQCHAQYAFESRKRISVTTQRQLLLATCRKWIELCSCLN